jgi:hypothetical protein
MMPAPHSQRLPLRRGSGLRRDTLLVPGQALLVHRLPWADHVQEILLLECLVFIADGQACRSAQCLLSSRILRHAVACGVN